ncbi:MAG: hypothetical protein QM497_04455 [Sulfurimonas sp.]
MSRFYFLLWLRWVFRISICSLVLASFLSAFVTAFIYVNQGMQTLSKEVFLALFDVFKFWFTLAWNISILIALFRSLKYIFNTCYNGYKLVLHTCQNKSNSEIIEFVGYGDLVKVWRKWLMLIIWLVGVQMILVLVFTMFFTSFNAVFDWFNIYVLYSFVLIAGYISFVLLSVRCKLVKVKKC